MDLEVLLAALSDLPLGQVRFLERIDSTNSEARRWIEVNRYRFKNDARGITELWRVDEE